MFGEDGWCHSCGVPKHAQNGNMVLQSRGLTPRGAWVPYGRLDTLCVDAALHEKISAEFKVEFRAIDTPAKVELNAFQIVIPTIGNRWHDPAELDARAIARHGTAGAECPECHVWRWYPVNEFPPLEQPLDESIASRMVR